MGSDGRRARGPNMGVVRDVQRQDGEASAELGGRASMRELESWMLVQPS